MILPTDLSPPRTRQTKWTQRRVLRERKRSQSAHLLRCNRHRPMVEQRCFAAETNFSGKFTLASHFKLPKRTKNKVCFGQILFEMTTHEFVLWFRLKYIGAFSVFFSLFLSHSHFLSFTHSTLGDILCGCRFELKAGPLAIPLRCKPIA